jgi:hypothetical protein
MAMSRLTYLHIRGTLAENMVYRPRPGHESTRPGRRAEGNPAFQLVLLAADRRVLVSVTPEVIPRGCGPAGDPLRFRVRGTLPLHPDGVAYELRRGEILLHAAAIPPEPPRIVAHHDRTSAQGLALHWDAPHTSDMTYSIVAEMESGRRITLARGLTAQAHTVDPSTIPAHGKATLCIVANDGVRSSESDVGSIDVPARPPTVHIIAPRSNSRLSFGQPVSVLGSCLDMSGQPCPSEFVRWSLDGKPFAAGTVVAVVEIAQPGTHQLTLAYVSESVRVESSVTVEVEEPDADYRLWEVLMGDGHPRANREGELSE